MNKKKVILLFVLASMLILAVAVMIEAAGSYAMPSKYKGLAKGVDKKELFKPKDSPCKAYGCGPWHNFVGDKATKKAYDCRCKLPADLKKQNAICFNSASNAKKAKPGYRIEVCRR